MTRNWDLLTQIKNRTCQVCGSRPVDPCHIRSVGAGGKDEEWNVIPMCRKHHTEQHASGWLTFLSKHRGLEMHLRGMGWDITESVGKAKLWHPNMEEK